MSSTPTGSPAVSVVLPTYNRAGRLPDSIQSVLDQTVENFELVVVDDASTDDTQDVVGNITDPRVRYVRHETNRGASAARNTGIRHAQADIVAFQDSDDVWLPEKLERHMEVFDEVSSDVGVVYTGMWRTVDGDERYLPYPGVEHKEGNILPSILEYNFISTPMAAVRRECFDRIGGFDEDLPALIDWELWIRMADQYRFEYVGKPLVRGAVHSDSISTDRRNLVEARERIVSKHQHVFDDASLANHQFFVGHGAMKCGDTDKGRKFLSNAVRSNPRLTYVGAAVLSLFGGGVYNLMYSLARRSNAH